MNQDILLAVQSQLNQANDNLYRAEHAFGMMNQTELESQHGSSGRSRASFLEQYRDEVARWSRALEDAKKI